MAFPPAGPDDAGLEYSPEGSNKTWIWDGNKWILIRVNAADGVSKLDDLTDVSTTNKEDGIDKGDLLSYNDTYDEWQVKSIDDILTESDDAVKILDDLDDVNIEDSKNAVGTKFQFYTNADPRPENGWGRYQIDRVNATIKVNKKDLTGALTEDLANKIKVSGEIGHVVTFENPDITFSATTRIAEIPTVDEFSYVFRYVNTDIIDEIFAKNESQGQIFLSIAVNEFRGLSDGAVLMYKDQPGKKWEPAFVDTGETKAEITLSPIPPANPNYNDLWIDSENLYMYLWTPTESGNRGTWVAVTGPGGIDGGSDIVNNSVISIGSTRGLDVIKGGTFTLNQPKNQIVEFAPTNIVILDDNPPPPDERLKSDIWIDTKDYKMYVFNGYSWVGLSASDMNEGHTGAGFNYIPCELDGGNSQSLHELDCHYGIDGGVSFTEYCEHDDPYALMRPGVITSPEPPKNPVLGSMWFDASLLELRVWYGTENSTARWVSALNPSASPILPPDPNPEPVRVTGPTSAVQDVASDNFTCIIGENLLLPAFAWSTTDPNAYIQPIGSRNVVQIVFSTTGTHKVAVSVNDRTLAEPYTDFVKVVVSETPANISVVYEVLVRFFVEDGRNYFVINNQKSPYLTLVRGRKYVFLQEDVSNNGFPLKLYRDNDGARGVLFEDGVVYGDNNSYLELQVANDAPELLRYANSNAAPNDPEMGGLIYVVGDYQQLSDGTDDLTGGQRPQLTPASEKSDIVTTVKPYYVTDSEGNEVLDGEGDPIVDYNTLMMKLPPVGYPDVDTSLYEDFEQPDLNFIVRPEGSGASNMYTFDQSDESNFVRDDQGTILDDRSHYIKFYLVDEDDPNPDTRFTEYTDGVSTNESRTRVDIIVTRDTPDVIYYRCVNHVGMLGKIYITKGSV